MSFRSQAKGLIGQSVRVRMTDGTVLTGRLLSVGTDMMIMRVRIGGRIRRMIIRLAEILFLFSLLGI